MSVKDWIYLIVSGITIIMTIGGMVWYLATSLSKIRSDLEHSLERFKGEISISVVELKGRLDSQDVVLENIQNNLSNHSEKYEETTDDVKNIDRRVTVMETSCSMRHEREDSCKS